MAEAEEPSSRRGERKEGSKNGRDRRRAERARGQAAHVERIGSAGGKDRGRCRGAIREAGLRRRRSTAVAEGGYSERPITGRWPENVGNASEGRPDRATYGGGGRPRRWNGLPSRRENQAGGPANKTTVEIEARRPSRAARRPSRATERAAKIGGMTWVVGFPSVFGYAVGVSDIRVTWSSTGKESDCLRKVFPVGPNLAAGFAGSVELGFRMISDMQQAFSGLPPGNAWFPRTAAQQWFRRGRRIFSIAEPHLQALGCEIILLGVSPAENAGDAPWGKTWAVVMRAPEFTPEIAPTSRCVSIGSGSQAAPYVEYLEQINAEPFSILQSEVGTPGGSGLSLAIGITQVVSAHPRPGISPHFHIVLVGRDGVRIGNNDHSEYPQSGPPIHVRMPKVATTWKEFQTLSHTEGLSAAEGVT